MPELAQPFWVVINQVSLVKVDMMLYLLKNVEHCGQGILKDSVSLTEVSGGSLNSHRSLGNHTIFHLCCGFQRAECRHIS